VLTGEKLGINRTEKQERVPFIGRKGERIAKRWLEERGFKIEDSFSYAHSDYYDILASKNGEKWIIEVKTGKNPKLNVPNFLKMVDTKGFHKIGLAIVVSKNEVYLLEIKKTKIAAFKAWNTRKNEG
jgi:Holliday junction resolvase-like predicted endonuclease